MEKSMTITSKNKTLVQSEEQLIASAKSDPGAFEPLYNKYHEQIFRFIWQRVNDKDAAYDITSQVFMKAIVNIKKYEYRGVPFGSWLYQISRNELNDYYRSKKALPTLKVNDDQLETLKEEFALDHFDELPSGDQNEQLIELINSLNDDAVFLIEMRYFEQRSFREISEILNITETNAKVRTYRILDKMKQHWATKNTQP